MKLKQDFYLRNDVITIAKELVGKLLITNINGKITSGIITETEAYKAPEDKASHAYNNKRTKRTDTMFQEGGTSYVYLCYGMHNLFNIVTNQKDIPHAVLVRAIKPLEGLETILARRNANKNYSKLTNGPGTLSQALGITVKHDNTILTGNKIWLEDKNIKITHIKATPRIGISYAKEYVNKPWRFVGEID